MESKTIPVLNFSILICYLIPGFTALQGLPFLLLAGDNWGVIERTSEASFSGLLSGMIEALATGLIVSTIRWLIIDGIHHRTGVKPPEWNFARLQEKREAFEYLVQVHYHYYQFHANMVIALLWAYAVGGYAMGWKGTVYLLLALLLFLGSRDCLRKYYDRAGRLLEVEG